MSLGACFGGSISHHTWRQIGWEHRHIRAHRAAKPPPPKKDTKRKELQKSPSNGGTTIEGLLVGMNSTHYSNQSSESWQSFIAS